MRSRLLLSVTHLPTIRETSEESLATSSGLEPPASPSLDDYVRSIRQLAQPTSVLEEAGARARPRRSLRRPAGGLEKSCPTGSLQDITAHFSGQQPAPPSDSTADPLDWLFGESQEKQPSRRELLRTGSLADSWGPCRRMDSGKARGSPRGRLFEARAPENSLVRASRDGHRDTRVSRLPGRALASPCGSQPNGILRTLYLHLPVIHEL
ncbi:protein DEPP1 [Sorex fumeus]|uniref:protein DEPP1 n=1 Tax=Sorex fumeus TaxID=62283 RepID=UPI0024AC869A|nr:protein DEPP1 [Sorex fumeus]XP_055986481.1 protein DEPP1 [Sorex fumeus]